MRIKSSDTLPEKYDAASLAVSCFVLIRPPLTAKRTSTYSLISGSDMSLTDPDGAVNHVTVLGDAALVDLFDYTYITYRHPKSVN